MIRGHTVGIAERAEHERRSDVGEVQELRDQRARAAGRPARPTSVLSTMIAKRNWSVEPPRHGAVVDGAARRRQAVGDRKNQRQPGDRLDTRRASHADDNRRRRHERQRAERRQIAPRPRLPCARLYADFHRHPPGGCFSRTFVSQEQLQPRRRAKSNHENAKRERSTTGFVLSCLRGVRFSWFRGGRQSVRHRVEHDVDAERVAVRSENCRKNSRSSPSRSHESPMSVLCVISTMTRPRSSAIIRKFACGLSDPRSEVVPPLPRQKLMLVTCGIFGRW